MGYNLHLEEQEMKTAFQKVIGVTPLYDEERDSYWMLPGYMKMLEAENAIPMMLPLTAKEEELDYFLEICGGFLVTGGPDVSPSIYHAKKEAWCGPSCELRDKMEQYILKEAVERDKSVLAICRGLQLMNVCYGGTLYQDLAIEHPSCIAHRMKPPYGRVAHQVTLERDTPLYAILGKEQIGVNSCHHQAIKELSPSFRAMAFSEDGLIESIYRPSNKFVVGVQWHPEFSYEADENNRKIINAFVASV